MSESQSSPETPPTPAPIIPETQDHPETSESDSETSASTVRRKHSSIVQSSSRRTQLMESEVMDPLEGSSWMHRDQVDMEITEVNGTSPSSGEELPEQAVSPVSSFINNERRRSSCFRMPELPKGTGKTKRNLTVSFESMRQNGLDSST